MDRDGDMKVDVAEFVNACLEDQELAELLESGMGGGQALIGGAGGGCDNNNKKDRQ